MTPATCPRPASRSPGRPMSDPIPLTPRLLRDWALPVPDGGKHARGSVLVIGGARATVGAVLLSGVAALRPGAGVLRMAVAASGAGRPRHLQQRGRTRRRGGRAARPGRGARPGSVLGDV